MRELNHCVLLQKRVVTTNRHRSLVWQNVSYIVFVSLLQRCVNMCLLYRFVGPALLEAAFLT